jgi:exopolyphosphatase
MYAFYLNETLESDEFCTVPIINMKRTDLSSHAELKWLLDSCHIDVPSLLFVDEVFFGTKLVAGFMSYM